MRNAEWIALRSIQAARFEARTVRLNSAFRIPHFPLVVWLMGGVWLAIDTATDVASVAVGTTAEVRSTVALQGARQQAARLVELIDQALARAAVPLPSVNRILVGDGPGSFTGLRIGWAVARGLAHDRALSLAAIPSLMGAAHAAAVKLDLGAAPVAACFDALRGQVFGAMYAFLPGRVDTLVAPAVLTLPELARVAPLRAHAVVGDGARRYSDDVVAWTGREPLALEDVGPIAAALLALAGRADTVRYLDDPAAEPVYGRSAEAQVKWEARHGRPLPDPSR